MRLYTNVLEMYREVERDLWEMGIHVHPETMQDKVVKDNPDFDTVELQGYGFTIVDVEHGPDSDMDRMGMDDAINYHCNKLYHDAMISEATKLRCYVDDEVSERCGGRALNPGRAWEHRKEIWTEFLHDGKFAYTYSERMAPQLSRILDLLRTNPNTRQAIINIHSNICPSRFYVHTGDPTACVMYVDHGDTAVHPSVDLQNLGGSGRIPCSMYYQFFIRNGKLHMVYTMRSCDFLTHFLVDICCAIKILRWMANQLNLPVGNLTYFTGSIHAYHKDMRVRGVF